MSFGQGGPPRGSGEQRQGPYGSGQPRDPHHPYGTSAQGQHAADPQGPGQPPHQGLPPTGPPPFAAAPGPYGPPPTAPFGAPPGGGTPDWAALADASAVRARRKRWLLVGGGVLATAAVAAIVATAIVSAGDGDRRATGNEPLTGASAQPEPTFSAVVPPPPPDPEEYISTERKDTAPLSLSTLFPGRKLTLGERSYTKGATARAGNCASGVQNGLGAVLTANGCDQVLRATYRKDGVAVTVGVAVFGEEKEAQRALRQSRGSVAPLAGDGVPTFCKGGPVCRFTANSYGRYAYFTATGHTDGRSVTQDDKAAFRAGDDLAEFTFRQIVRRGEAQARAAATGG
ncbi:hypothetical protein ACFVIM_28470 [Streptomyces sp. NPDC057638]|uniref:hypothetical protein n=1 Tax=Streptomyces sp. NPDC057638 TaxID=3346190 RepID=UPI0036854B5A